MGHQTSPLLPYTGLSPLAHIRVERRLPAPGEILVHVGEQVSASQPIVRIAARGAWHVVNVARRLGLDDPDLSRVMLKKRGDRVEAGEAIAARRGALPFLHKPCRSPVAGRLAAISHGWVAIESAPSPQGSEAAELLAFVAGRVAAITDQRSVTIETTGAHIVGACGVGGEGYGVLHVAVDGPDDTLAPTDIGPEFNKAVLVAGAGLSPEVLDRAREMNVAGIIVGSMHAALHALTPPPPFPIVATEGYGDNPMAPAVFDMLRRLEGREVFLEAPPRREGGPTDERPVIIVSLADYLPGGGEVPADDAFNRPARIGDRVRAVRRPLSGKVGEIVAFSDEPERVSSGLSLIGAQVAFAGESLQDHQRYFVPWLNLERIG